MTNLTAYVLTSVCLIASTQLPGKQWRIGAGLLILLLLFLTHLVGYQGAIVVAALIGCSYLLWNSQKQLPAKLILASAWTTLAAILLLHVVPDIYNLQILHHEPIKPNSIAISISWNIDKIWIGWAICAFAIPLFGITDTSKPKRQWWRTMVPMVVIGIAMTMSLALILRLVTFDIALPHYFVIFASANLLNTCIAEEALFRGIIQNFLIKRINAWGGILVTALLFGLVHAPWSPLFAVVAAVAGIMYGAVYWYSGRLIWAILIHWTVNLIHMLLFTYPLMA